MLLYFYSRNLGKSGLRVSCLGLGKYQGYHVGVDWEVGDWGEHQGSDWDQVETQSQVRRGFPTSMGPLLLLSLSCPTQPSPSLRPKSHCAHDALWGPSSRNKSDSKAHLRGRNLCVTHV